MMSRGFSNSTAAGLESNDLLRVHFFIYVSLLNLCLDVG